MKANIITIICYALVVFAGGLIGFLKANSFASLATGIIFSLLLVSSAIAISKGFLAGIYAAILSNIILLGFFSWRYVGSYKFMPAGLMAVLSFIVLLILFYLNREKAIS